MGVVGGLMGGFVFVSVATSLRRLAIESGGFSFIRRFKNVTCLISKDDGKDIGIKLVQYVKIFDGRGHYFLKVFFSYSRSVLVRVHYTKCRHS